MDLPLKVLASIHVKTASSQLVKQDLRPKLALPSCPENMPSAACSSLDATDVTNAEFEKFVKATGCVTIAESAPTKEELPEAPPENLMAGSIVFTPTSRPVPLTNHYRWWRYQQGANWRHPDGPQSDKKQGKPSGCANRLPRRGSLCEMGG